MKLKKAKFRVVSCFLAAAMSLSALSVSITARNNDETMDLGSRISDASGHRYIYAQVERNSVTNDENSTVEYDAGWVFSKIGGKYAMRCTANSDNNLFLKPSGAYWTENNGGKIAVTVEYYDSDDASFSVLYSTDEVESLNLMGTVVTEGTNAWKTKTFYADDFTTTASIRIAAPGWQISSLGKQDVYIGNVFVEENKTEHPVEITPANGTRGLIYDYGSSDSMTLNYDNFSGKKYDYVQTKYTVRNHEGTVLTQGSVDSFPINNGASVTKTIHTGVTACGTFTVTFDVRTVDSDGNTERYTDTADFSVVRTVAGGSGRHDLVGVTADLRGYQQDNLSAVKGISKIGISKFKAASYWNEVEKTENTYTYNNVTLACDSYLSSQGVDTIYVATQIPSFYNDGESSRYYVKSAKEAYGRYVVDLVEETGATAVEILNEINHRGYNDNWSWMLYRGYAYYVKAAYDALHSSGHSDVKVIAGALAGADTNWMEHFISETSDISANLNYFDAISYHAYYYGGFDAADFSEKIDEFYALTGKPVIISEMGWSSAEDADTTANGVKMYQKASYIPEALLIAQSKGAKVDSVYLYTLSEWGEYDKVRDYKFGLLKSPSGKGATDAYVTLGAFCDFFHDATINRQINKNQYGTVAMEFTRPGKQNIAALWTSGDSDTLALNLGCSAVTVYDMYGTPKGTLKSSNGIFTFDLSEEPIYIEGNFTSFTESTAVISLSESKIYANADDSFVLMLTDTQSRTLNVELDYNKEAVMMQIPPQMSNGSVVLHGITGDKSGHYHVGIKLYDADGIYYIGSATVEIDASEQGVREPTTLSEATASYDSATRIATVTGTIQGYGPNDSVTVLVQSDADQSIAYVGQAELDNSGLFTQFKMPADADGIYTVKICGSSFTDPVALTETKLEVEDANEDSRVTTLTGGVCHYDKNTRIVTVNGTLHNWKSKDALTFMVTEDGYTGIEVGKIRFVTQAKLESNQLNYQFYLPEGCAGHYNLYIFGSKFGANKYELGFHTEDQAYITGFTVAEATQVTASAQAQNVFDEAKNVCVIIAQYSADEKLLSVSRSDTVIPANTLTMTPCSCSVAKNPNAAKVSAFVWDSADGMNVLAGKAELH